MKRIIFLLVAVCANALLVSCSREQDLKDSYSAKGKIEIPLTDYGFYHNEALDLYYKKYNGIDGKTTGLIIDEMLAELKIKYPEQFKNMDTNEVKLAFQNIDPKKFDMYSFWNSKKEELYASNKVSKRLGSLVDNIIEDNMDYNKSMVAIENFKKVNYLSKTSNTLTVDEQNELIVLENVLKSSNQYWTDKNNSTKKTNNQPGSKAIIADTMGALMFVYSGPMSIIAGGVCSLFVNEAIPFETVPYEEESINL
ncbi:hypothetical protein [uncultured Flavobacterium sp.]|uniref:hypothetical protein n=1 Tax=uncultured Flavobacterium sp. TaxID=165435 RepID=UPI0025FD5031|nr:hypothetical protein [uncultured Flavobacterium sp.]